MKETTNTNSHMTTTSFIRQLPIMGMAAFCFFQPLKSAAQDEHAQNQPTQDEKMAWFREAKFGLFINLGVYSQLGGVYQSKNQPGGSSEWIMNIMKIPVAEYRKVASDFNIVNYNADAWCELAKEAGMKYIVFDAKHHDGFALFKTKASKWNIVDATPYKKDPLEDLSKACKKHGLKLGIYYSHCQDWVNPGGAAADRYASHILEKNATPEERAQAAKIDTFIRANNNHWDPEQTSKTFEDYYNTVALVQMEELLTNYGRIDYFWFDTPRSITPDLTQKTEQLLKRLQPHILINDRLGIGRHGGDVSTPERVVPPFDQLNGGDWESCQTMNTAWGWKSWDHNWKDVKYFVSTLAEITGKGGNFLLNVGPKPDGAFPQESIDRLKQIGVWMKVNSEAIYGVKANPLTPVTWGALSKKDDKNGNTTLYASLFTWPENNEIVLSGLKQKVTRATFLANGKEVKTTLSENGLKISLPAEAPDNVVTVIKLEVDGHIPDRVFDKNAKFIHPNSLKKGKAKAVDMDE
jgi:alpha-L-fucosidase